MRSRDKFSNWVEISLEAIDNNMRFLVRHTDARVMAVVKADAYGHGAVRVAAAAVQAGATWCGVARLEEALELRTAGIDCPILILGLTPVRRMLEAIEAEVSLTVWDIRQVEAAAVAATRAEKKARLHLKVDTGMGRIGVQPEKAVNIASRMVKTASVIFEGIFTHFARADEQDPEPTEAQEIRFQNVLADLTAAGLRPPVAHAANSAAMLTRTTSHFDLVRIGIAMYGLHPSRDCLLPEGFLPVLSWKTQLGQIMQIPAGRGVSYGHDYVTTGEERIGSLSVGYGDGFKRVDVNVVLVGDRQVSVVGRVCMDQTLVQLDDVPDTHEGDVAVLIGNQGEGHITTQELADRWGTINYEVVCGIASRVPRVYV